MVRTLSRLRFWQRFRLSGGTAIIKAKGVSFGKTPIEQSIAGYFTTCLTMSGLSLPTMTRNPLPRQRFCLLFLRF